LNKRRDFGYVARLSKLQRDSRECAVPFRPSTMPYWEANRLPFGPAFRIHPLRQSSAETNKPTEIQCCCFYPAK
jgi:hypothetical protein